METFYLLALIPVLIAGISLFFLKNTITWLEAGAQLLAGIAIVAVVYWTGTYSQIADKQVINGYIQSKARTHDTYLESYSCNCRTVRVGKSSSRHCSTCYRRHYTVSWDLKTTVGPIRINKLDSTWSAVYLTPDPTLYTQANVNDPCAKEVVYDNYIQGAPNSIFHNVGTVNPKLQSLVPPYPYVYDIYKVNHVALAGYKPSVWDKTLDRELGARLRTLGAQKQVNIVVVLANTNQKLFKYALEREWLGGKKNDVVVVIGTTKFPDVQWVDVFTYANTADNNKVAVAIRDDLLRLKTLEDPVKVANIITTDVARDYKRKPMSDYEYLMDEVEPPGWVIMLAAALSVVISLTIVYFCHRNDHIPAKYKRHNNRYRR